MLRKNIGARDTQFRGTWNVSTPTGSSPGGTVGSATEIAYEKWGTSTPVFTYTFKTTTAFGFGGPNYQFKIDTPGGSYDTGTVGGSQADFAEFVVTATGAYIVVNSDCTWNWAYTGLTVTLQIGALGPIVTILTLGAASASGSAYDERLNGQFKARSLPVFSALGAPADDYGPELFCNVADGSWSDFSQVTMGYQPKVAGIYTPEVVALDGTASPGVCSSGTLPSIGPAMGANSWNLVCGWTLDYSLVTTAVVGPITCSTCSGSRSHWTQTSTYDFKTVGLGVHATTPAIDTQRIVTDWECQETTSPGYSTTPAGPPSPTTITTSGSNTTNSSPAFVTCSSEREVYHNTQVNLGCYTPLFVGQIGHPKLNCKICWPIGYTETRYHGEALLSWPTAPLCGGAVKNNWLIEDVFGQLHVASVQLSGDVIYRRSLTTVLGSGWVAVNTVTAFGDVVSVCIDADTSQRVWMAITRVSGSPSAWLGYSDDNGASFGGWVLVASNALGASVFGDCWGGRGVTWFTYNSGSSGPGTQHLIYKGPGDTSFSSAYTLKDSTGTAVAVADAGWCNIAQAQDNQDRLVWAPTLDGDTVPTPLYSSDRGVSWKPG